MTPGWRERVRELEGNLRCADAAGAATLESIIYALSCRPQDFEENLLRATRAARVAARFALGALGRPAEPLDLSSGFELL